MFSGQTQPIAESIPSGSMDDLSRQARQGSVGAIVQVLNQQIAEVGVRIRGIFADGVLQLLCEAKKAEQLERSALIPEIRAILESICPRNIRRVRISSRMIQEQQLLWLEEINRDPDNQLLWYEDMVLRKPNFLQQLTQNRQEQRSHIPAEVRPEVTSSDQVQQPHQFRWGLLAGAIVSLILVIVGVGLYQWLESQAPKSREVPQQPISPSPSPPSLENLSDTQRFAQGVRLAEEAVAEGRVADTREEWLAIADKWEMAADLMAAVSINYERYDTAQNRAALYRRNSETAELEAERW